MENLAEHIHTQFANAAMPAYREGKERLFKEQVKVSGARSPDINTISKQALRALESEPKARAFSLCEEFGSQATWKKPG